MDPEKYMFEGKLEITPDCRIGYVSQFSQARPNKGNYRFRIYRGRIY